MIPNAEVDEEAGSRGCREWWTPGDCHCCLKSHPSLLALDNDLVFLTILWCPVVLWPTWYVGVTGGMRAVG